MNRMRIVARETLKNHIKSASFWVMLIAPLVMMVVSIFVGYMTATSFDSDMYITATEDVKPYFADSPFNIVDENELDQLIADEEAKSYAKIRTEDGSVVADLRESNASSTDAIQFNAIIDAIQADLNQQNANLSADQAEALAKKPIFNKIADEGDDAKAIGTVVYYVLLFLMYLVVVSFVQLILTETATEKGTKMIEFIFSSVRPGEYFQGKIFGNFLAALIQMVTYTIFGLAGFAIASSMGFMDGIPMDFTIDGGVIALVLEILVLFLLGVLIFLIIAGMLGSFATKVEDAGKMGSPIIIAVVLIFFLALNLQGRGDIMFIKVLSYIPLASTFFMPLRLLNGYAGLVEGLISIVILILAILAIYKYGEKVYKNNILNYSTDKLFDRGKK